MTHTRHQRDSNCPLPRPDPVRLFQHQHLGGGHCRALRALLKVRTARPERSSLPVRVHGGAFQTYYAFLQACRPYPSSPLVATLFCGSHPCFHPIHPRIKAKACECLTRASPRVWGGGAAQGRVSTRVQQLDVNCETKTLVSCDHHCAPRALILPSLSAVFAGVLICPQHGACHPPRECSHSACDPVSLASSAQSDLGTAHTVFTHCSLRWFATRRPTGQRVRDGARFGSVPGRERKDVRQLNRRHSIAPLHDAAARVGSLIEAFGLLKHLWLT